GRFDATLGFSTTPSEQVLDIAGNASSQDLVFRFQDDPQSGSFPAVSRWLLGSFDANNNGNDPTSSLSSGSTTDPGAQDDPDFAFYTNGGGGTGRESHFVAGDIFDPIGTGSYLPTELYTDKDSPNSNSANDFDRGLMGDGAADGEIRYLGFTFSPDGVRSDGLLGTQKLAGWIAVQINQVDGPDGSISRDDTEITLLDYSYTLTPDEAIVIGQPIPSPGSIAALAFGAIAGIGRPKRRN
ncbi:MAG: hypothetical protein AAGB34_10370, partial [Planctomycetota bacterium]